MNIENIEMLEKKRHVLLRRFHLFLNLEGNANFFY